MRRTSLRTVIGQVLTGICTIRAAIYTVMCLFGGDGLGMLAQILATVSLAGLFVAVRKYHDSEDMAQWPAIFMCGYLGSNILLIFSSSWTYALMILPLIVMILLITMFSTQGIFGIGAGTLMIVLNLIGGFIIYKTDPASVLISTLMGGKSSSLYMASLLVNNNSLMGIACILYFCQFPRKQSMGGLIGSQSGGSTGSSGGGGWV